MVIADRNAARVLQRHRLDFCCGGRRTLGEACAAAGLDPQEIVAEIEHEGAGATEPIPADPASLTSYIIERYHVPLREEVPRLCELARRVEQSHGERADCPHGIAAQLEEMRVAIENHLGKEEQILFPMIRAGRASMAYMPVQVMMQEHDDHGANLRRVRELTNDLTLPGDACTTWRALYDGLNHLELELMEHIHLENNVLFPAVLAG